MPQLYYASAAHAALRDIIAMPLCATKSAYAAYARQIIRYDMRVARRALICARALLSGLMLLPRHDASALRHVAFCASRPQTHAFTATMPATPAAIFATRAPRFSPFFAIFFAATLPRCRRAYDDVAAAAYALESRAFDARHALFSLRYASARRVVSFAAADIRHRRHNAAAPPRERAAADTRCHYMLSRADELSSYTCRFFFYALISRCRLIARCPRHYA